MRLVLACAAAIALAQHNARAQEAADPAASGDEPMSSPALPAELFERVRRHSPLPARAEDPTNGVLHDERAAELGRALFFDSRLSRHGTVSCATCHDPAKAFGDGAPVPPAFALDRNAPTLWNAAHQRWFFWNGRADSLWAQALQPLENELEHDSTRVEVVRTIAADRTLRRAYEDLFGALPQLENETRFPARAAPAPHAPASARARAWRRMAAADRQAVDRAFANAGKSLAAYVARLTATDAPFDRFVEAVAKGDPSGGGALGPAALRGLELFFGEGGCRACHAGPLFSDREFHDLRLPGPDGYTAAGRADAFEALRADVFSGAGVHSDDRGAGARKLAGLAEDAESWGRFRTPTLRNVALTAPYMHDGRFATLHDVLQFYSTLRGALPAHEHGESLLRPRGFSPREVDDLIAFLESLTDTRIDPRWTAPPTLPSHTDAARD